MTALRAGIWTCLDPGGASRIRPGNPGWELARPIIATHRPGSRGAEGHLRLLQQCERASAGVKKTKLKVEAVER